MVNPNVFVATSEGRQPPFCLFSCSFCPAVFIFKSLKKHIALKKGLIGGFSSLIGFWCAKAVKQP